jgi:hypothetical protein
VSSNTSPEEPTLTGSAISSGLLLAHARAHARESSLGT